MMDGNMIAHVVGDWRDEHERPQAGRCGGDASEGGVVLDEAPLAGRLVEALCRRCHFSTDVAAETVRHFIAAERAGKDCHGLIRLQPLFNGTLKFENQRIPQGRTQSPSCLVFDGAGCLGYAVAAAMLREALDLAKRNGMCLALGRHVYPSGYLGYYGRQAAEAGFIVHIETTSPSRVTAPGHRKPFVGTNPICRAYPVAGSEPVVVDLATSAITHGDLLVAQASGSPLPPHAAVKADGSPVVRVEDFDAAKESGALLPFGGRQAYKSFALALSVGLQCSFSGAPPASARGSDFAISMLVIDPSSIDPEGSHQRAAWLRTLSEVEDVRIPGWQSIRRAKSWEARRAVPIASATWKVLQQYI